MHKGFAGPVAKAYSLSPPSLSSPFSLSSLIFPLSLLFLVFSSLSPLLSSLSLPLLSLSAQVCINQQQQ